MYLTKKLVNRCETFHLSLQFGKWKTCFRRQWNYLYCCLFQICTFLMENNSVCEFCMCTSAHTLCVCKQSVECGVMSIFNQSIFYFHGNWARLMLWNSNCQKFRTLNMDLSNAAILNGHPNNCLHTTIGIFCDAHLMGWDLRLPVSLSLQVVEEEGDSEIFWNNFTMHYLTVCLLKIKKEANVVYFFFSFSFFRWQHGLCR